MLVDINLLPKKESKPFQTTILFISLFVLFIGTGSWIGIDYYLTSSQLEQKKIVLEQEKKLVEVLQQKLQETPEPAISSAPLLQKVEYVRSKDIEAVSLLQHLVALLPERGYFMKYEYKDRSTITIDTQFDTLADTSHYLHELTNTRYLTEASIEKMETSNFEEVAAGEGMTEFEGYLPRYHAQYKIHFNKENLHELSGEE
jgi:type IV pilus assembly protein PilN